MEHGQRESRGPPEVGGNRVVVVETQKSARGWR